MIYENLTLCETNSGYCFCKTRDKGDAFLFLDKFSNVIEIRRGRIVDAVKETSTFGIVGMIKLLSVSYIVLIKDRKHSGSIVICGKSHNIWKIEDTELVPVYTLEKLDSRKREDESYLLYLLKKYLQEVSLYYSTTLNLTESVQLQYEGLKEGKVFTFDSCDTAYFANFFAQTPLIKSRTHSPEVVKYIIPCIEGYVDTKSVLVNDKYITITLISRRQWKRFGTRYYSRGLDNEGYASNFVETEQIVSVNNLLHSFVQIRGSIPLFWGHHMNCSYHPKLMLSSMQQKDVTSKHFEHILKQYEEVVIVNLIRKAGRESPLAKEYKETMLSINNNSIKYRHFDFNGICKTADGWEGLTKPIQEIESLTRDHGYFSTEDGGHKQKGLLRINCIDCLDRTNVFEYLIAEKMLCLVLQRSSVIQNKETIEHYDNISSIFRNIWANNADKLSMHYTGTKALKTDFTRWGTRTLHGMFGDMYHSVYRYFQANFFDYAKDDAFYLFYGKFIPNMQGDYIMYNSHKCLSLYLKTSLFIIVCTLLILVLCIETEYTYSRYLFLGIYSLVTYILLLSILKNGETLVYRPLLEEKQKNF